MSFKQSAQKAISDEIDAIQALLKRLDDSFTKACQLILNCQGKVVLMGVGKSGHIAAKIAATLASTGTPAFFIHGAEAGHGDLGMINDNDVIIAISYSGENEELKALLPIISRANIAMIAMTGHTHSTLAKQAQVVLNIAVDKEACPHNLAPTSSTTTTLVLGDALAIALLTEKNFTMRDFAKSHPSGHLGRKLLTLVSDVMHTNKQLPLVSSDMNLLDAIVVMSKKRLGIVIVVDRAQTILGIFTDGDLRRTLEKQQQINQLRIGDVMTNNYHTIKANILAAKALAMMQNHRLNHLPVVDNNNHIVGIINMHTLLDAKII